MSLHMGKYLAIFNISWQNEFVYRLNFILWRFRMVLQLLMAYFIWSTVFKNQNSIFGYTQKTIITYILIASFTRAIIFSSRLMDVAKHINEGGIINFLVKPQRIIDFYFARDLADKTLNVLFSIFEILLILIIFKPPIILQSDIGTLFLFALSFILGIIIFFSIGLMFGLLTFWLENIWGIYFLFFILIDALGGGLFPIDVLPQSLSRILLLTPFPYLLYFPVKVYLGSLDTNQLISGFSISFFWVIFCVFLMKKVLNAGLRNYTAVGG